MKNFQSTITSSIRQSSWFHPSQWDEETELLPDLIIRDKYRLEEELGNGAMGVVWKASDLIQEEGDARDSHVAIKFLSQDFKQHPDALKALVREFNRYKRLNHPHIVKAHGLDRLGSSFFMVMELLKGVPLDEFIKIHPNGLSLSEAEPIIKNMGHALAYAHQEGIAHLDFKPANVFYEPDRKTAKVIDFGIARPLEQSERAETQFDPGSLGAFTYTYASCEMLLGLDPDPRDDIYALACVTYELLSGKHPFNRKKASTAKYEKLSPKLISDLNRQQNQAIRRALAFHRDERTATVDEFLAELFPEKKKSTFLVPLLLLFAIVAGLSAWEPFKPSIDNQPKKVEQERQKAARLAAEQKAARQQAEATRLAAEQEAARQQAEATRLAEQKRQQEQTQVAELLKECQKHLDAQRLTTGSGGTALACYQEVLKQETGNAEAMDGLQQIEHRYQTWAENAFKNQQLHKIPNYLKGLETVNPQSPILADLRERLAKQREQARKKAEAERLAKQREQARKKAEAERLAKQREQARKKAEAERLAKQREQARKKAEAERLAKKREQARKKAEAERLAKKREQARKKAEAERLAKKREQARKKAEAERLAKKREQARKKAEAKRLAKKREEEARIKQAEKERLKRKEEAQRILDDLELKKILGLID